MKTTVTKREAAALLGTSVRTLDTWLVDGRFPTTHHKAGGKWIIPTRPLLQYLGIPTDEVDGFIHSTLAAA